MNKQLSQLKREIKALNKDGWNVPYGIIMDSFEDFIKLERQEKIDKINNKMKEDKQTSARPLTSDYYVWGYNQALQDIIKSLK